MMWIVIVMQQLLLIASVALVGLAAADEALLDSLCKKDATAEINSIAQVQSLIATLDSGTDIEGCKKEAKQSILDLKPIIEVADVCSCESFEQIAKYTALHVHEKTIAFQQDKEVRRVPPAIKNFFIAYGLQVSRLCRVNLMQNLAAASSANIPADDLKFVTEWIDDNNKNYQIMVGKKAKLEELLLLGDMKNFMSKVKLSKGKKEKDASRKVKAASVSAENKAKVDDLKARCAQKFKPIYDKLIVPIIQLSYIGFNYMDRELADSFSQFEDTADYKNWFKIVFICDSILNMKVVSVKNDKVGTRFLTENNMEQLKHKQELDSNEPALPKPIDFEQAVRIDPAMNVFDRSDVQLLKSVANYSPKSSKNGILLKRAARNMPKLLETYVRTGKVQFGLENLSGDKLKTPSRAVSKFGRKLERSNRAYVYAVRAFLVLTLASVVGLLALPFLASFTPHAVFIALTCTITSIILFAIIFGLRSRLHN